MGFREDLTQNKGATPESINALPTYKFKVKKSKSGNKEAAEGGIVAAGTEKERVISGEDAVNLFPYCQICLLYFLSIFAAKFLFLLNKNLRDKFSFEE